ncbi:hypothetical protein HGRIS_008387 [Hohenbuehelia grisea]|uniref:Heterokaryon incompatibility Het-C n=1 Tax=Hohenbuehelia grisea TaxID=104357 RepID=A0ABR3J7Z4_9AGAR
MPNLTATLLILTVVLVLLPPEAYAFGAGDIPDFSYLNDKAFRHGDIENILEGLVKSASHTGGGGLLGFAQSVLSQAAGGAKFNKSDIKKVYFGNWLRDYSQAMDIAGLSKLTSDTLVLVVSVLGFMTFGFCTEEFEVTPERLGVYLPVEHIDNPKGYAEKEGDARQYHPKLRPPVDPRELEIDERTGMKKYMATENEGWDTSTALIRRVFRECIEIGRRSGGQNGADLWEAYRLLGTGLHTLEDLLAHSNWCEIALRKMGHSEVFCHVGDNVVVNTPNGQAPPIVTGTFGGADFLHSLMGEATDKLSQASVTDLTEKMNAASQDDNSKADALRNILKQLPIGGGSEKVDEGESMHEKAKAYHFDPNNVAPPDVQKQLWDLLKWRDSVYRDVLKKLEMVPGLTDLIDELTNALNAYVYTVLAPYLGPILQQATGVLGEGSKAVIDSDDQYAVFSDPNASDPSHSLLSKDHFGLILNEPAGKIAQVIVQHTVAQIVKAWSDDSNPDDAINVILEAFHHPYYANGHSTIQREMFETMEKWFGGLGPEMGQQVIDALSKDSVRAGKNKRIGSEEQQVTEPGYSNASYGSQVHPGGGYHSSSQHQYDGGMSFEHSCSSSHPFFAQVNSPHTAAITPMDPAEEVTAAPNRVKDMGEGPRNPTDLRTNKAAITPGVMTTTLALTVNHAVMNTEAETTSTAPPAARNTVAETTSMALLVARNTVVETMSTAPPAARNMAAETPNMALLAVRNMVVVAMTMIHRNAKSTVAVITKTLASDARKNITSLVTMTKAATARARTTIRMVLPVKLMAATSKALGVAAMEVATIMGLAASKSRVMAVTAMAPAARTTTLHATSPAAISLRMAEQTTNLVDMAVEVTEVVGTAVGMIARNPLATIQATAVMMREKRSVRSA